MIRVMMLAPVLVVMGFVLGRRKSSGACREKSKIAVPWFAFGFIGIICPVSYTHLHHWLILHGRYVCTARAPKCGECGIAVWCRKYAADHKAPKG